MLAFWLSLLTLNHECAAVHVVVADLTDIIDVLVEWHVVVQYDAEALDTVRRDNLYSSNRH